MLTVETAENLTDIEKCRKRWSALQHRCNDRVPFLSFEWYISALRTIDRDRNPLLLFFSNSKGDVGLAPLLYRKDSIPGLHVIRIGFVQNPYTPYQKILHTGCLEDVLRTLIEYIRKRFGTAFLLSLDEMRLDGNETRVFEMLASRGYILLHRAQKPGSRYIALDGTFESKVQSLKGSVRKEFRRKIHRISRLGTVRLLRVSGSEEVKKHLEMFFSFYARTWKGAEPHEDFYYTLFAEYAKEGKLYFYALTVDEKPVAYLACLREDSVMYGIKTTYHPSYYAFSPGIVLFYRCIETMFDLPDLSEFDIGRGSEQFKGEWTSLVHEQWEYLLYPKCLRWRFLTALRYSFLPWMKKSPLFDTLYSSLRFRLRRHGFSTGNNEQSETQTVRDIITPAGFEGSPLPREYTVRYAGEDDIDRLVIAMSARKIKDVADRLKDEKCILVLQNGIILAYFWISTPQPNETEDGEKTGKIPIEDWDLVEHRDIAEMESKCIASLFNFLSHNGAGEKITDYTLVRQKVFSGTNL
jgi:hypothetical protein